MAQLGNTIVNGALRVLGEEFNQGETIDGNLDVTTINGVTVGSSPKFTDASVTAVGNHYTPTCSGTLSANATGATAAWSIDVVKGVTLQKDAKGHVTGMSVSSGKIPANPNTDTKVTAVANHYTPTCSGTLSASASGGTAAWSVDVVKGVTLEKDAAGHITNVKVTSGKTAANPIPSNNVTGSGTNAYLVKFTGANTIGNGPAIGSDTTKYLRNDGTWEVPPDHTYTAATAAPGAISTTGAQGTSTNYARQDHTHSIALATGDAYGQVKIASKNIDVNGYAKKISAINSGSGTAATSSVASGTTTYYPAKWKFNTGAAAANNNIYAIKMPTAGHSYGVFLSVDDGSNYYPVSVNSTTRLTTYYPNGYTLLVAYNSGGQTNNIYPLNGASTTTNVSGGNWYVVDYYDSGNNFDRNRYYVAIKAGSSAIVAANIIVGKDGVFHHLKDGTAFDITYPILYAAGAINANATSTNNYDVISCSLQTTQTITLTAYKPVYIKGTLSGTTFTPISTTPLTQTVPTAWDGYYYMLLGVAYNTSSIYLNLDHGIYVYQNGGFRRESDNIGKHAEGYNTTANGIYSHAEGFATLAFVDGTHAEGEGTTASGNSSHAEGKQTSASGNYSHAEGGNTTASDYYSHAEGYQTGASSTAAHAEGGNTTAKGECSHAEGGQTIAKGNYSHAEGYLTSANGVFSHAEGYKTTAYFAYSHAEGYKTITNASYSHAEGYNTSSSGNDSHAEGDSTTASSSGSHAEGYKTIANASYSHAEGESTTASGFCSHAEGHKTTASNSYSHSSGHYNAAMTTGGSSNNTIGTAFVIGNGTASTSLSNAFSVQFDGTVKAASTITASTTADYAEYFEWYDGNPNDEDRVGYFVTFDSDNKIKIGSNLDEYILGISSGEPFVLGNGDCDVWNGMILRDDFRRVIYEPAPKLDDKGNPMYDEQGNPIYEGTRPKLNPKYDPARPYINRADRPEWQAVGMLGVLAVRDNGQCQINGYCTVASDGTAKPYTDGDIHKYRVIHRNSNNVIEIIFR